ncbi:MAG: AarF/ABC1/UbiB kinase family protein [Myxococcota bacterium]|nr:AarF/ABC1/UbiB kinase family protein [Myxococcota bacterium]
MGQDWEKLAGDEGSTIATGRFGRALKVGRLAGRLTGGFLKESVKQRLRGERGPAAELEALVSAAGRSGREIAASLGQLKGAAMKIGQLLSADPDLIDPAFAEELSILQRSAPPMRYRLLADAIESRLGASMAELFCFFDPKPLGSASIGQVHRAILHDGREVAIKVQYPGVADSLDSDLKNLSALLKLARVFLSPAQAEAFVAEARQALLRELDYEGEAENLERFGALFETWPNVRVPAPIRELCAPGILTMEYIKGRPLIDACKGPDLELRRALGATFIEAFVYMFHERQTLHGDPHPGNFLVDEEGRLVLLDLGCVRDFPEEVGDEVLRALLATLAGEADESYEVLRRLGFGREGVQQPTATQLYEHHRLILAPFFPEEGFNFARWSLHEPLRLLVRENLELLQFTPPSELLIYLRVLAGIKGILSHIDATLPVREISLACCVRRELCSSI